MNTKSALCTLFAFLAFTGCAFAQADSAAFAANLRSQYGPALNRETFRIPAGEMLVDYSPNGYVCRIQLPPTAPEEGTNVISPTALDNFLLKLVPISLRGKELGRMSAQFGLAQIQTIEYENVTISAALQGTRRTGVTVTFKSETCADQPAQ